MYSILNETNFAKIKTRLTIHHFVVTQEDLETT